MRAYTAVPILASSFANPANPAGTTSATPVMAGLAGAITPVYSGKVLIAISGYMLNTTTLDGSGVRIRTGTGGAPANGAAQTGTARTALQQSGQGITANTQYPFSISTIVTGLALGTAIWIDLDFNAIIGGTTNLFNINVVANEIL